MNGLSQMSEREMKSITGGKCNSDYGYFFCCPSSASDMRATINHYLNSGQKKKASKYIQFCYEDCGYN